MDASIKYNRIKIVLAERDKKSKWLYQKLNVSQVTVSRWVRNDRQPTIERLYEIAEALNVPVCSLLIENEVKEELKDT